MIMKQTSVADRRSLVHPPRLGYDLVLKSDPDSGKFYLGKYEPIDNEKLKASIYELDACLKSGTGFNLQSTTPIDYLSFDQRLAVVESQLSKISEVSKSSKFSETPKSE